MINPSFYRFRKTAIVLYAASWIPFGVGLFMGADAAHDTIKGHFQQAAKPVPARKVGAALLLTVGSYAVSLGAMGYLWRGRRKRLEATGINP